MSLRVTRVSFLGVELGMEASGQVMVKGVFLTGKAEEAVPGRGGGTKEASRLLKASLNLDPSFHLVLWGVEQAYNVGPFLRQRAAPWSLTVGHLGR